MNRPEAPFRRSPSDMDKYCHEVLRGNPAGDAAAKLAGLGHEEPLNLAEVARQRGASRQTVQAHLAHHTAQIAERDQSMGGLLENAAKLTVANMAWSGVGRRGTRRNRVPERTARELNDAAILEAAYLPHLRLAALAWRLDLTILGEDLMPVVDDAREEMFIAETPCTSSKLVQRLRERPDADYRLAGWHGLCIEELLRLRTGITTDTSGLFPAGHIWADGMAPERERVAHAIMALRKAERAMTGRELAEAVDREKGTTPGANGDTLKAIQQYATKSPHIRRSAAGMFTLAVWNPLQVTRRGAREWAASCVKRTLERYGAMPLDTLAATVAELTGTNEEYVRRRIRQANPKDPWQTTRDGYVWPRGDENQAERSNPPTLNAQLG